jgi:hypothetical protein
LHQNQRGLLARGLSFPLLGTGLEQEGWPLTETRPECFPTDSV